MKKLFKHKVLFLGFTIILTVNSFAADKILPKSKPQPDKEIVRTVLGKVFGLDEYKEDDVISSQKLDVSTISDSFAVEYLKMIISSIRGQAREPFMPNLTDFENVKSISRAMKTIQPLPVRMTLVFTLVKMVNLSMTFQFPWDQWVRL